MLYFMDSLSNMLTFNQLFCFFCSLASVVEWKNAHILLLCNIYITFLQPATFSAASVVALSL